MIGLFFQCRACQLSLGFSLNVRSFPLCESCLDSLVSSPSLCAACASPLCEAEPRQSTCLHPWVQNSEIDSYSARYLLIEPGYTVLRKWKINQGLLFSRRVLSSTQSLLKTWRELNADAIIPIPQSFHRSWRMRGSPTGRIAGWVAMEAQLPIVHALRLHRNVKKRQAEQSLMDRLENRVDFSLNYEVLSSERKTLKNVILVDDFMTTGGTLRSAAQTLKFAGVQKVHVFCLGIRISKVHSHIPVEPKP